MTANDFIQLANKQRKALKNKWVFLAENVDGKEVALKSFNTSIQILRVNGINHPSLWDASVKEFTNHLQEALTC